MPSKRRASLITFKNFSLLAFLESLYGIAAASGTHFITALIAECAMRLAVIAVNDMASVRPFATLFMISCSGWQHV